MAFWMRSAGSDVRSDLSRQSQSVTYCLVQALSLASGPRYNPYTMLLDQLHNQKDTIEVAARQYGARRIRVFGSVARREERPDSDIDFLVDFPPGYDLFTQRLPLAQRLSEITGRRLDLIPEHELNRHLRDVVLSEAVEL